MRLEDLEIYQIALRIGDEIWDIVIDCNNLKVKLWNYIITLDKKINNEKSNKPE